MPRDERETLRNGARTASALKGGPHGGSGGHNRGPGRTPAQHAIIQRAARLAGKPNFWDSDDDDSLDGGNVTEYAEYPKHVYPWGREKPNHLRFIEVNNLAEEEEAMASGDVTEREGDKRARLIAIGEVKGLKLDGRWSLDKMEAAIVAAGHDPSLDPSK